MARIHKSLAIGNVGQEIVKQLLYKHGISSIDNTDTKTRIEYDITCSSLAFQRSWTVEIKYDLYSQRSGNLAIEFFNSKSVKNSGIEATTADVWSHVLPDGSVWFCRVDKLLEFTRTVKPLRVITAGGDKNADLKLYEKSHILEIFTRVDGLTTKEIVETIKGML
jgi:hypothetical protein